MALTTQAQYATVVVANYVTNFYMAFVWEIKLTGLDILNFSYECGKKPHSPQHRVVFLSLAKFVSILDRIFAMSLSWWACLPSCVSSRVDGVIGNITGLMAVVFLSRFCTLLCDARAVCEIRSSHRPCCVFDAFDEGRRRPDRGNTRVSHKTVENGQKAPKLHQEQKDNPMLLK